jgi:hypothetical protein
MSFKIIHINEDYFCCKYLSYNKYKGQIITLLNYNEVAI